jgi:hypothetical protein
MTLPPMTNEAFRGPVAPDALRDQPAGAGGVGARHHVDGPATVVHRAGLANT